MPWISKRNNPTIEQMADILHIAGLNAFADYESMGKDAERWNRFRKIIAAGILERCYVNKEYEAKANALQKAVDIIHELNASLDVKKGGEIARNLRSLYLYMIQRLTEADLKKDIRAFDDVIQMLEELESARISTGRIWTDEDYEKRRKKILATPLP